MRPRIRTKIVIALTVFLCSTRADSQVLIALIFGETLNTGQIEFGLDGGVNLVTMS